MSGPVALVYVNWGMWVAGCPRDGCLNSEHLGHAPISGHVGGLTEIGFRCSSCGLLCEAEWPDNAEDIWYLLSKRPVKETRNWHPHETLEELLIENTQHGIMTPGLLSTEGGITLRGNKFANRELASAARRIQIGA
jgi:hypothetical protein